MEDHELDSFFREILAGTPEAFERFYLEFIRPLIPFLTRRWGLALDDAEDVTHDVMLRVWASLRKGTQEFSSVARLRGYVKKAAQSVLIDSHRLPRFVVVQSEEDEDEKFAQTPEALRVTNRVQELIEAEAAFAELTDTQWRAFILYERYGLTYREIAEVERCRDIAIRGRLEQARAKIAKWLDQQHDVS